MPVITAPPGPTHVLPGTAATSLATPSRGSAATAVWRIDIDPGTPPTPHWLTREEVFVVLGGVASVRLDDVVGEAREGAAIVVPPDVRFELTNASDQTLRMICCLPVGGQARLADGSVITPPWAQ
jgi:quercetin dioxygenase-like cupin family protein